MKLAETCVKYPVFTVMLIAFLVTLGVFSYRGLAVDLFPKADPATVNVNVQLPGATPEEVITGVVLPLEDAISSVSGIDEINVYSSEGFANITCTFVLERDIEGAAQDIREKVAAAINRLPRDTLPPIITKEDPQSDPITAAARHAASYHHQGRPTIRSDYDAAGERADEPARVNGDCGQASAPRDSDRGRRRKR